jgi:type IV pilus assembly protein PilB
LPEKIMRARHVFPLELVGPRGPLAVALSDAGNLACLDEISFAAGIPVRPVLAVEADVDRAIVRHLGGIMPGTAERPDAIELSDEPVEENMDLVEAPHTPRSHH